MLVVGALLAAIGNGVTAQVYPDGQKRGRSGWRGWFYMTMWAHPIVAGALLGVPEWLPAPEFMGSNMAGRVIWYAISGVFSSSAYDAVMSVIKQRAAVKEKEQ
jgi:hypothetical protein